VAVAGRFSRVALGAVGVLVATGAYQAWRQVRSWGAVTATTYGRELLVKLALVALILVVAAASRRWVRGTRTDVGVLRRRVAVEAGGIVAVLAVTSALVATAPARSAYHPSVSANLRLGPDVVQVSAVPAGDRRMQVHLYLFDRRDRPTEPRQVTASVSLPSQHIGPLPLRLSKVGRGHRIADVAVPVAGDWSLAVVVRTSAIDEYTRSLTLPIR
jgi:copper transport protein